jgi:hypothetical protein
MNANILRSRIVSTRGSWSSLSSAASFVIPVEAEITQSTFQCADWGLTLSSARAADEIYTIYIRVKESQNEIASVFC